MSVMSQYDNAVYLYGHNHGGSNQVYINRDTFERITSYSPRWQVVNDRLVIPSSFITSFMGSMSYYAYPWQTNALGNETPAVIQTLLIYVYKDRLVFTMKNIGDSFSTAGASIEEKPLTWTVMRDIAGTNLKETSDNTPTEEVPTTVDPTADPTATPSAAPQEARNGGILWIVAGSAALLLLVAVVFIIRKNSNGKNKES